VIYVQRNDHLRHGKIADDDQIVAGAHNDPNGFFDCKLMRGLNICFAAAAKTTRVQTV